MNLFDFQLLSGLLFLVSQVSSTTVVENATYDDLNATALIESPVGTYKFLKYNSWVIAGETTGGVPVTVGGLASKTPPVDILTAVDTQLTNGTPTFTIAKPYNSFSLLDFYFGCVARDDQSTVGVASQCTITVAGFQRNNNKEICIASYTFTPPPKPLTPVSMIQAVLPSTCHQPLYNVTIAQDNKLLAIRLDNLHYSVST